MEETKGNESPLLKGRKNYQIRPIRKKKKQTENFEMYGGLSRNNFMVTVATKNINEGHGATFSKMDSTSTSTSFGTTLKTRMAVKYKMRNENGFELRTEVEEAIKLLRDDCEKQHDELLLIQDLNGATETVFFHNSIVIDQRSEVQDDPKQCDDDIAETGISSTVMANQKRCVDDENYVPNGSKYEESEDEYLDTSKQMERKRLGKENCGPENNEVLVENIEEYIEIKRKRRRKPDTLIWKRQESKTKREKGETYDGLRKNEEGKWMIDVAKPPRQMKPFCNCKMSEKSKKIKCRNFTEEDRQHIFNQFWQNMSWAEKKVYISSLVDNMAPKDLKNRTNETSRRSNTFKCHLKKNGVRERVCQVMFINTLSLGTWSLHNWATLCKDDNMDYLDSDVNLTQTNRINRRHETEKIELKNFFMELPKLESHYCRVSSKELNLSEGEEIILYSDGCTAQNKNAILSNALLHLSVSKGIIITQKYLVSGHTQMECDSMHSSIERKIRNREIYSPAGYIAACKSARLNPKPYQVKYLNHKYFKNFSALLNNYTSIRPGCKTGDPTVNDLCAIQYRPDGKLYYKLNFDDTWMVLEKRQRKKNQGVGDIVPLYQNQLPIKKSKYDHLQQLKEVIPADYHLFYDTLPFELD
ncbi:unnamed protein product [Diabrotica balteata]|uniref:Uncharacterized protein n=1 Tax=Diabrotica balteata TaxID=107213 RepID=A0A9N9XA08_DIABA|nr:unnamed protein product [Diabrotica balteata]